MLIKNIINIIIQDTHRHGLFFVLINFRRRLIKTGQIIIKTIFTKKSHKDTST